MKKIDKRIYFCNKFNFKDEYAKSVFGGHPKKGHLYKYIKESDNDGYIIIETKEETIKIYAPEDQLEDPRYDFEFFEYNAENFYRANMIPEVEDPVALWEWFEKEEFVDLKDKSLESTGAPTQEEVSSWIRGEGNIPLGIQEGGYIEMSDDVFINVFFNDLKAYFPDIYEAMMISMGRVNEYISSEKYDQELPKDVSGIKRLMKKYKESKDGLDLTAIYISIMNIFMEQNKGEE